MPMDIIIRSQIPNFFFISNIYVIANGNCHSLEFLKSTPIYTLNT